MKVRLVRRSGNDAHVVRHGVAVTTERLTVALVKKDILELDGHFVISLPPLGEVLRHGNHRRGVERSKSIEVRVKLLDLFRLPAQGL